MTGRAAPRARTAPQIERDRRTAGLLLCSAGAAILMGSVTAEALYPRTFTTHLNTLSHLGATEPPDSLALQPSAAIFDTTMLIAGALILLGTRLGYRALRTKWFAVPSGLLGVGVLGVGLFPLTVPGLHTIFALTAFYAGGLAVIMSSRLTVPPFRYLWLTLGSVSLIAITLGVFFLDWGPIAALGEGGIERWNAYPIVLWLVAFGGYLMAGPAPQTDRPRGAADAQTGPVNRA